MSPRNGDSDLVMPCRWLIPLLFLSLAGCCTPAGPLVRLPKAPDVKLGQAEGVVTWHTSLRKETAEKIIQDFQEKVPIRVEPTYGTDAELRAKLLSEESGQPRPDVFQSTDPGVLVELKGVGLLRPAEFPNRFRVPPWLTDSDASWVAPYVVTAVMAYRTDKGPNGKPPIRWQDLRDSRFRDRLIVPDPSAGGPAFYWGASLAKLYGWGYIEAIGKNAVVVPYEDATMRLLAGGAALSGGLSGEDVWRARRDGRPVAPVISEEGIPVIPAGAALLTGSSHPNAGALFLNYLLSADAQRIFAADGFYAARADVAPPAGRAPLNRIRLLQVSWERTARRADDLKKRLSRALQAGRPAAKALKIRNRKAEPKPLSRRGPVRIKTEAFSGPLHPCGWFRRNTARETIRLSLRQD